MQIFFLICFKRRCILFALTLLCVNELIGQKNTGSITIDVRNSVGKVNSMIFGNSVLAYQKGVWKYASSEYWDRGAGIWNPEKMCPDPEMLKLAQEAGITVLRYPGAQQHYYWKRTIGPLTQRPDQKFGLPEYLQYCSELNAIPLITIPEYSGTAQDAADMVEYLNSLDDGTHPYAHQRLLDGHPDPWNVVWFEYGNETNFGDGLRKMSPEEYAKNYLMYSRSMKSIDPRIKLGLVGDYNFRGNAVWLLPILKYTGSNADFIIHHAYIPHYERNDGVPPANELFKIALASEEQIQNYYEKTNNEIFLLTGKHIPIAVTEYNGHFTQLKPVNYRFTLGNALLNAMMIKNFMNPHHNIIMANSWQFSNEAWGAVRGYAYRNEPIIKRPLFYVFELYHEHFGNELIQADVQCDSYETSGGFGVLPTKGKGQEFSTLSDSSFPPYQWSLSSGKGFVHHADSNGLAIDFQGEDVNYYHAQVNLAVEPDFEYRASAWIKTDSLASVNGICLSIIDGRGWDMTKYSSSSNSIVGTHDWQKVEVQYLCLPDAKSIKIQARRVGGGGVINGRAYIRNLSIQKCLPQTFPAVPYLSINASRTMLGTNVSHGKQLKVNLMIVNKNMSDSIFTTVQLLGMMPTAAKAWFLTGPTVDATNEIYPTAVSIRAEVIDLRKNGFRISLPPHSLTAVEIE
jgi:alpha-L-arabinofuranosidase